MESFWPEEGTEHQSEAKLFLPCSQDPAIGVCSESIESSPHPPYYFSKICLVLSFHPRLGLLRGMFSYQHHVYTSIMLVFLFNV